MGNPAIPSGLPSAASGDVVFAAQLIEQLDSDAFLPTLFSALARDVAIKNFIVFSYRQGFAADLVHSNLDIDHLGRQMQPYTNGLYMLDPFYVADMQERRHGLLHLGEVAPEDFETTEFFVAFYAAVGVLDEAHYVVPLGPGRSVHLFMEREAPQYRFSPADLARLRTLTPLIDRAVRRHWAWRDRALAASQAAPIQSAGGIDGVIRNMGAGQLTPREAEVIALSLRGHSSKLIAHRLGISEGTVTNHKRNVYEKLGVHSQSQLFSLFLETLSRDPRAA